MALELDIELVMDRFIGTDGDFDVLQTVLARQAPDWWESAHIYVGPGKTISIDIKEPDGLAKAVRLGAFSRGETYQGLMEAEDPGPGAKRLFGMAELRGGSPAVTVVVKLDQQPFGWRRNGSLSLGNALTIQIGRKRVSDSPQDEWAERVFRELGSRLLPVWGRVSAGDEYEEKVMGKLAAPPGARGAVGRDFARYLPGVFWLNFFGPRYIELFGRERLSTAPVTAEDLGSGIMLKVGDDPHGWREQRSRVAALIEHLGAEFFFNKAHPQRDTRAPEWDQVSNPGP